MARSASANIEQNFTKGLVTEATGLNFPENACTETWNCVFNEKGKLYRRLGMDYEVSASKLTIGSSMANLAITNGVWDNVGGNGDYTYIVVQLGATLFFYRANPNNSLSSMLVGTFDITAFQVAGAPSPQTEPCGFASGNGAFFVCNRYCDPFYIQYSFLNGQLSGTVINVQIRDFDGVVDDATSLNERPASISSVHHYNIFNQGWFASAACGTNFNSNNVDGGVQNVIDFFVNQKSVYPSSADVWWLMENSYEVFAPNDGADRQQTGNTRATNGHFILQAFNQDRAGISGINNYTNLPIVSSGFERPRVCVFHSNRLYMSGVQSSGFSNKIYFSQIIVTVGDYGMCYQQNDPTNKDLNDLLPTDGGVIVILGAGAVYYLASVLNSLVVFTTTGIWAVSGSQGSAIAANDYSVSKISDIYTYSSNSFVYVNSFPIWWNGDGIFSLAYDKVSGSLQVQTLTDQTIRAFYDTIPALSKLYAQGSYNSRTKVVQWTYRSNPGSQISDYYQHDRVLCFNTLSEAFYPWRIPTSTANGPWICGAVDTYGQGPFYQPEVVADNMGNEVVDNAGHQVVVSAVTNYSLSDAMFYPTISFNGTNYQLSFAQERDPSYFDWSSLTPVDYTSYALSGFKVHGQAIVKFQVEYLNIYMDTISNSSCFLQTWWDYVSESAANRMSIPQQVYHVDSNFSVSRARVKIRGEGLSMQYKLYSESGKPFQIIGWAGFESGNKSP